MGVNRNQPQDIEAECALLGALILDLAQLEAVEPVITAADMWTPRHQAIYAAIIDLRDRKLPGDLVHLSGVLKDRDELAQVGGLDYLLMLAESVPSAAAAGAYARRVAEKSRLRKLLDAANRIAAGVYESDLSADEQIVRAEAAIYGVASAAASDWRTAGAIAADLRTALMADDKPKPMPTGLYELDIILDGGFHADDGYVIVGARPSQGKTALVTGFAEAMLAQRQAPVAIVSAEMSGQGLVSRIIARHARVSSRNIRRADFAGDEFLRLSSAVDDMQPWPLYIDDTPSPTVAAIRSKCRSAVRRFGVKCIMVDYLQLLSPEAGESRVQEVTRMSNGLKSMQRELRVPVVVLSQLNRASANADRRPGLADLRDSGAIEQDADVVILIHREGQARRAANPGVDDDGATELIVAKQRNGVTDTARVVFDGDSTSFRDATADELSRMGA